jgi:putative FmdB family regulatory protein
MPTYNYECKNCGAFEAEHSIKLDAYKVCPKCGGTEIKRLIGTNTNFILKGSGFYETDYKRASGSDYANKASADKSAPVSASCAGCDKAKGCGK